MFTDHRFHLQTSRRLAYGLSLLYGGTMIILLLLPLNFYSLREIVTILCLIDFVRVFLNQGLRTSDQAVVQIWQNQEGFWLLKNNRGDVEQATLENGSLCSTQLVVLNFKLTNRRRRMAITILPDAMTKDHFRRLRILLRNSAHLSKGKLIL